MSQSHFRFLHAADFALHQPLYGFAEMPETLGDLLIDAPYQAAQRVFDAALEERVDFLVLSGDLVDLSRASPRAIAFLLENFERLDAHGIATYWSAGKANPPSDWPASARLPNGVQVFPSIGREELSHFRGDRPVANIVGRSWHGTSFTHVGEFKSDTDGLPTIVVCNGQADTEKLEDQVVDYWALGGQPQRQTQGSAQRVIHYSGSPQGRCAAETGAHGATLVHVASDRTIRTQFLPTDTVRWITERMPLRPDVTLAAIKDLLADRVKQLKAENDGRPLLITWKLRGGDHLGGPAKRRELSLEWLAWLRKEFSMLKPSVWTLGVELYVPLLPDDWTGEDSMLGDFLRHLGGLEALSPGDVDLLPHIPEHHRVPALAALAAWTEDEHQDVLHEAALTGAHLLGAADREVRVL
jgi:DNA repair exonuclease SbcCD nuclease subunit